MLVGFDAKRLFFNWSGLGNYSRSVVQGLTNYAPEIKKIYFTPRFSIDNVLYLPEQDERIITPKTHITQYFSGLWRSFLMGNSIIKQNVDVFHGLSAELPLNIKNRSLHKVVTIHDLIFLRFPHLYSKFDAYYYNFKYRKSAEIADTIIAISQQTKEDIIHFWNIKEEKIVVLEQPCKSIFYTKVETEEKHQVLRKYNLPSEYLLCVGTIEERKNALDIVRAMVNFNIRIPLVLIGKRTPYFQKIMTFAQSHGFEQYIIALKNVPDEDLPSIYQSAAIFLYPSIFEGFGIPIVEAMYSGVPIITSTESCLPATGGKACLCVKPDDIEQMGTTIERLLTNRSERERLINLTTSEKERFNPEKLTRQLVSIYTQ